MNWPIITWTVFPLCVSECMIFIAFITESTLKCKTISVHKLANKGNDEFIHKKIHKIKPIGIIK